MGAFTAFCGRFAAVGVVLYRVRACGGWCSCWLCSDPVVAYVPGRRGGGWCSRRGLFAFLLIICVLHVAVFGVFPII